MYCLKIIYLKQEKTKKDIIEFSVITKRITDRMLNPEFMIIVRKKYVI